MKRVLYVSKNIAPPWNDGSKNLVRDLANHVTTVKPCVLTSRPPKSSRYHYTGAKDSLDLRNHVETDDVYRAPKSEFSPDKYENARVLWRLMARAPEDLRHYVFAPNPRSSNAARWMKRMRPSVPVVQTVASAPKVWDPGVFFGDHIVVQSQHSQARLAEIGIKSSVIWPCAPAPKVLTPKEIDRYRLQNGLYNEPMVLYAGDYEVSTGAETVARAAEALHTSGMQVVFACRKKTAGAEAAQKRIEQLHDPKHACHLGELTEGLGSLLNAASVVVFPVEDLWGKVDLPMVLLEALALGKPVVVASGGPLAEIPTAVQIPPGTPEAILPAILRAAKVTPEACKKAYHDHFRPEVTAKAYEHIYGELLK
jgi:glycosyltransferase involved in cell wall biosynthesis